MAFFENLNDSYFLIYPGIGEPCFDSDDWDNDIESIDDIECEAAKIFWWDGDYDYLINPETGEKWVFLLTEEFYEGYLPYFVEPFFDPIFEELPKIDPLKRGIFTSIMAYTSLGVKKLAGDQKYYVNDRNEVAEGFGDFMKIGAECLRWDKEDIDTDGWQFYDSVETRNDCFELCLVSENCVGV